MVLLYLGRYAPFGKLSLAYMDADIQYVQFYSYYKDVLAGNNSIFYSFSKVLGGNAIAVYSYYLSSPVILLSVFFAREDMQLFFDVMAWIKISAIAVSFQVYLMGRFSGFSKDYFRKTIAVILSVSFALSQYCIAQTCNIMWLDGVFMLPLILLMVYRLVRGESNGWGLTVAVGAAILFNWYSAGLDCLFSGIWLVIELFFHWIDEKRISFRGTLNVFVRYVWSMGLGIALSAMLFLPTISALRNGNRGYLDIAELLRPFWIGNVLSSIPSYTYGATSDYGRVALFCGCLTAIGCVSCFLSSIEIRKKMVLLLAAAISILMMYWNPLYIVFSLFKIAESYHCRFSYLNIFVLLFTAAMFFESVDLSEVHLAKWRELWNLLLPAISGMILAAGFGAIYLKSPDHYPLSQWTAVMMMLTGVILTGGMLLYSCYISVNFSTVIRKACCLTMFGVLLLESAFDLGINASMLMRNYSASDLESYRSYIINQKQQIASIKEKDKGLYRIAQTFTRNQNDYGYTALYDDSFALNYWSISGYTSSPDDNQRDFLQLLGYPKEGKTMNITDTTVVAGDALLGAKYVLAKRPVKGLVREDSLGHYNEKDVYRNPFVLPMAFQYCGDDRPLDKTNQFLYQNSLYSRLLSRTVEIYKPVKWDLAEPGDSRTGEPMRFTLQIPKGNYALYGDLPWNSEFDAVLNINGAYSMSYAEWLSSTVFDIPVPEGSRAAFVEVSSQNQYDIALDRVVFYALDLDLLAQVTQELSREVPENLSMKNGAVSMTADRADGGDRIYLSVPYDKGWSITLNGRKISADTIDHCMYTFSLSQGVNQIEMRYHVPRLREGIWISILAAVVLIGWKQHETKRAGKEK